MKIIFDNPISEGDVTRNAATVGHYIIYPGQEIVLNNKDGSHKTLPIAGLSENARAAFDAFESFLTQDSKEEYQTGAVTARAEAKKDAEKEIVTPIEGQIK